MEIIAPVSHQSRKAKADARLPGGLGSIRADWLFRPPYGEQSIGSNVLDALWLGYEVVGWSLDVGDWYETDSSLMASRLVKGAKPGCVVLLHDALFDEGKPHLVFERERELVLIEGPC